MRSLVTGAVCLLVLGAFACGDSTEALGDQPPPPETRERDRPTPTRDPGPRVWRPSADDTDDPPAEGSTGGGSMRRERNRRTLTATEIQARLASLRTIDTDGSACEQAFEALRQSREGLGDLLDEERMGGPNRADYLSLCRVLPPEVQRCFTPAYQASHRESCEATLARFGEGREDPAWLERLTGRPASERPAPATTEAEARALRRRR
jgi:hypothetical protein